MQTVSYMKQYKKKPNNKINLTIFSYGLKSRPQEKTSGY